MATGDRIAEVFEDLATEVTAEVIVYEDFIDLNPGVTTLSNLSPDREAGERSGRANSPGSGRTGRDLLGRRR